MSNDALTDRQANAMGWGVLIAWWGICFLPGVLPDGVDAAGTGVIFLAASAIRRARGREMYPVNLVIGTLSLLWGVLDMSRSVLHVSWRPPVLAILLVAFGIELLAMGLIRWAKQKEAASR